MGETLPTRTLQRIMAEAFRHGWAFIVRPDGSVEVTPPRNEPPADPFELVDMSK